MMDDNNMNEQNAVGMGGQYDKNMQYGQQYGVNQYGQNMQYGQQYGMDQYSQNMQQSQQYGVDQYGQNMQYGQQYGANQYGQSMQYGANQYGQNMQQSQQYGADQYGQNMQYGQQYGADQYGQNMQQSQQAGTGQYDQQNVYNQTVNMYGDQTFRNVSPKKEKGIKTALIATIAALALIAVCVVVYFVFIKKTPKEAVQIAIENTGKELEDKTLTGLVGADQFATDNVKFESDVTIDKIDGADEYSGARLDLSGAISGLDTKFDGAFTYNGESVSAEMLIIDQIIYLSSPEILTNTIKYDTNSVLAELEGQSAGGGGMLDSESLQKIMEEKLGPSAEEFKNAVIYEKVGKEEFENANGDTVKATKYTITVPTEAFDNYADAVVDCLNEYVDNNISDDMLTSMGVTKSMLKQQMSTIPAMVGAVVTSDVVVNVYVDGKKMVHMDSKYNINLAGIDIKYTVDCMGDDDVTSDSKLVLSAEYGQTAAVSLECNYKSSESGSSVKGVTECLVSIDEMGDTESVRGENTFTYDKRSGAIENALVCSYDGESIEAVFDATLSDVDRGEAYSLSDMNFELNVDGEECVSLSGNLKVSKNTETFAAPTDVIDYSDLTGEDADKYINTDKLESLNEAWADLLDEF